MNEQSTEPDKRLSVAYLVAPLVALVFAAPALIEFRVGRVPWWMSNLPFWIGLAGAPGYVYVWSERWRRDEHAGLKATWIHVSLAAATLASLWGAVLLLLTGILWVFPGICAALAIHLWRRFMKGTKQAAERGSPA